MGKTCMVFVASSGLVNPSEHKNIMLLLQLWKKLILRIYLNFSMSLENNRMHLLMENWQQVPAVCFVCLEGKAKTMHLHHVIE